MDQSSESDLKTFLRLLHRKKLLFLIVAVLVSSAIVIGGYLHPKTYEARSVIFIERNVLNELIKNVTVTSAFDEKVKALAVVMKSRSLLLKVMSDLDLDAAGGNPEALEGMIRNFQEKTEIKIELNKATQRDMDVFTVSYTDNNPTLAANYVNTLVRRYIEENLSIKRAEAYGASKFILDQIATYKVKLDKLESTIARQRREQKAPETNTALADRLDQLMRKRDELLVQYTENHPEVARVKAEIEVVKEQLRHSSNAPAPLDQGLLDLERERETTKKLYEELLATLRRSEVSTELEVQDKAGAFRILDPAIVPSQPLSPNMVRIILLALAAGIGAGAGLLVLLDRIDPTVKSVRTIKNMGLPVLAVISSMRTEGERGAARRKDRLVYAAAGMYLALFLTMTGMEIMGLGYVDKFIQGSRAGIGSAVRVLLHKS